MHCGNISQAIGRKQRNLMAKIENLVQNFLVHKVIAVVNVLDTRETAATWFGYLNVNGGMQ